MFGIVIQLELHVEEKYTIFIHIPFIFFTEQNQTSKLKIIGHASVHCIVLNFIYHPGTRVCIVPG